MKSGAAVAVVALAVIVAAGGYWSWVQVTGDNAAETTATFTVAERRTIASTVLATGVVQLRGRCRGTRWIAVYRESSEENKRKPLARKSNVVMLLPESTPGGSRHNLRRRVLRYRYSNRKSSAPKWKLARVQQLDIEQLVARTDVEDRTLDLADARARLEKGAA